jgi:hypothetical protein
MHDFYNEEIFIGVSHSCSQITCRKVAFICDYLTSNNPGPDGKVTLIKECDKKLLNNMWYIVSEEEQAIYLTDAESGLSVKLRDNRKIELALYGLLAPFFFANDGGPVPLDFDENSNVMSSYMFHYNSLECLQRSLSTIQIRDFCSISCSLEVSDLNIPKFEELVDIVKKTFKTETKKKEGPDVAFPFTTFDMPYPLNCKQQKSPRVILTLISRE